MAPGLDTSRLTVADARAALRTFPDRYRSAMAPALLDDDAEHLAHRAGPDGRSAVNHVDDAARTLVVLARAIAEVAAHDDAVVPAAVVDESARHWAGGAGSGDLRPVLDDLDEAVADVLGAAEGRGDVWARTGRVTGGGTVSALALLREAVRTASARLADARRAVGPG